MKAFLFKIKKLFFIYKYFIVTIILFSLLIISIAYVYLLKNKMEREFFNTREQIIGELKKFDISKLDGVIKLDEINFNNKFLFVFGKKIKMISSYAMDIPKNVKFMCFDKNNIYLVVDSNLLCAYSKNNWKILWQHKFQNKICDLQIINEKNIAVLMQNKIVFWNNNERKINKIKNTDNIFSSASKQSFSANNFKIIPFGLLIPNSNSIALCSQHSMEELCKLSLKDKIKFISDYDTNFQCLYLLTSNNMIKINFIKNEENTKY